jgi:hypothetical protein
VRCHGCKASSSEAETRSVVRVPRARRGFARGSVKPSSEAAIRRGSVKPSSEAEIHPRERQALERGGDFTARRLALERGGGSPKGYRGWLLDGSIRLLRRGPFSSLGRDHAECVLRLAGLFVCFYYFYFLKKGCFPLLLGDPYGCP